jgi:hypothetical protein
MKRMLIALAALVAAFALPTVGTAHNLGHTTLPDGTCRELGSGHDGPIVGQDRTQLDLIPGTPRDEFGVSFVGVSGVGRAPILPGPCPAAPTVGATAHSYNILDFAQVSFQ